jgi:hypothetical protein
VLAALAAVVVVGVGGPEATAAAGSGSLPVTPGAQDVLRRPTAQGESVDYDVREPYPASQAINQILAMMENHGWTVAEVSGFGPPQETVEVPTIVRPKRMSVMVRPSPITVHGWEARWRNARGQTATFRIQYRCTMEELGLHSAWAHVTGTIDGRVVGRSRPPSKR